MTLHQLARAQELATELHKLIQAANDPDHELLWSGVGQQGLYVNLLDNPNTL